MKLIIEDTELEGLKLLKPHIHTDERGNFVKTFHKSTFEENNLESNWKECFFSTSAKNSIRGMHYQKEPHDHNKLVFVMYGAIIDVAVDIRKDSPTYGKHFSIELNANNGFMLYIPKGFAHGFQSLENGSLVYYYTSTEYHQESDSGIRYDSFDLEKCWHKPYGEISLRDLVFTKL
jgi:dTDP-4-dehydrorhamnose 3,5-epimerase/CDP-3, 6-dideoxy-D-glycero-D-glycero-4-hexulose-5-epimerase